MKNGAEAFTILCEHCTLEQLINVDIEYLTDEMLEILREEILKKKMLMIGESNARAKDINMLLIKRHRKNENNR